MAKVNIYRYKIRQKAVLVTGNERTYNMPIQNSVIKVHKGANQPLDFHLFDADGKPLQYTDEKHVVLKVTNKRTGHVLFEKHLEHKGIEQLDKSDFAGSRMPSVGRNNFRGSVFGCRIDYTDIINYDSGTHYRWTVYEEGYTGNDFMYTGIGQEVTGEFWIEDGAAPQTIPSTILEPEHFRDYSRGDVMDAEIIGNDAANAYKYQWKKFVSHAIPGDAHLNVTDGMHTLYAQFENFTGHLIIQGCLDISVPDDSATHKWFNIPSGDGTVIHTITNFTGNNAINFHGNFMWLRIVYYQQQPGEVVWVDQVSGNKIDNIPDTGKINRIIIRN